MPLASAVHSTWQLPLVLPRRLSRSCCRGGTRWMHVSSTHLHRFVSAERRVIVVMAATLPCSSQAVSRSAGARRMRCPVSTRATAPDSAMDSASTSGISSGADFIRPHLRKLAPYTPIEPFEILSAKLGRSADQIIKLDANENPYGPPKEVLQALGSMAFPNIYPDPETRRLRAALAKLNEVPMENILVGCGADELIDLLMRCVLDPGDTIVDCPPTFTMYAFDADVNGAGIITVPRNDDFSLDVEGIKAAVQQNSPKIVFLTSPNNPDGSVMKEAELEAVLKLPVLVVLDEAYIEFSEEPSRMPWVTRHPNLVVLRTFSKSAGLAGIRVGYGAFPTDLIDYLWRAKQPYNVSVAAEVAACTALDNYSYMQEVRDLLVQERERLFSKLTGVPFLQPYASQSNFILCKVLGKDALAVKTALAQDHGIMVRHYNKAALRGYIRISVGKPEHTDALIAALSSMA